MAVDMYGDGKTGEDPKAAHRRYYKIQLFLKTRLDTAIDKLKLISKLIPPGCSHWLLPVGCGFTECCKALELI